MTLVNWAFDPLAVVFMAKRISIRENSMVSRWYYLRFKLFFRC